MTTPSCSSVIYNTIANECVVDRIGQIWETKRGYSKSGKCEEKKKTQPAHTQQTQQANLQAVVDFLIIELYIHEYSTSKDNYRTYYRPSQTVRAPLTTVSTATTSNHFRNKVNAPNQDIYDVTFALIVSRVHWHCERERASQLSCLVFISCYANRLLFLLFFLVDTLPDVVGPCVCVCVCYCVVVYFTLQSFVVYLTLIFCIMLTFVFGQTVAMALSIRSSVWCGVCMFFSSSFCCPSSFLIRISELIVFPLCLFFVGSLCTAHSAECRFTNKPRQTYISRFFC